MSLPPAGTRRVLVTGGGTGIGRAIAERLLAAGGKVVVTGRRPAPLEALAAAHPGRAFALPCDLADPAARAGLVGRAKALLGSLDGLVHAAGVIVREPLGAVTEEALRLQLEVNLVAPLRLGEEALAELAPGGAVVFEASTLAVRPVAASPVYAASKAGLHALVKSLALAGAPRLRASAVVPGVVETDMVADLPKAALEELHPLGRLGAPDDVAAAVVHLLGASWTTGAALLVDGGLLLRE